MDDDIPMEKVTRLVTFHSGGKITNHGFLVELGTLRTQKTSATTSCIAHMIDLKDEKCHKNTKNTGSS